MVQQDWQKFLILWQEYQPLCLNLIHKYRGESWEDINSELKVLFFELLIEYDDSRNIPLPGYIKAKLERRLYNRLRKVWLKQEKEFCAAYEETKPELPQQPGSLISLRHLAWSILTAQQKKVLTLIFFHSQSERQAAKLLSLSPSRINKIKQTALEKLRQG